MVSDGSSRSCSVFWSSDGGRGSLVLDRFCQTEGWLQRSVEFCVCLLSVNMFQMFHVQFTHQHPIIWRDHPHCSQAEMKTIRAVMKTIRSDEDYSIRYKISDVQRFCSVFQVQLVEHIRVEVLLPAGKLRLQLCFILLQCWRKRRRKVT